VCSVYFVGTKLIPAMEGLLTVPHLPKEILTVPTVPTITAMPPVVPALPPSALHTSNLGWVYCDVVVSWHLGVLVNWLE